MNARKRRLTLALFVQLFHRAGVIEWRLLFSLDLTLHPQIEFHILNWL